MKLLHVLLTLPILLDGSLASPLEHVEKRHTQSCGVVGYDRGQYVVNRRECSVSDCAASCKKSSKCQSYGYGNKVCRLYSVPVKNNVRPKSDSPYKFCDKACSSPATKTTKTTTTTKKATPKSTTSCITTTKKGVSTTTSRTSTSATSSSMTSRPVTTSSTTTTTTSATISLTTPTLSSTSSTTTPVTTTTTTPVTTTTSSTTIAATTTTIPLACPSNLPFTLESVRDDDTFNSLGGYIPQESMNPRTDSANLVFEPGFISAVFTLDSSCHLVSSTSGNSAVVGLDQGVSPVIFDAVPGFIPGVCTVLQSGSLSCAFGSRTGTANQFALDDMGRLYVGENIAAGVYRTDVVVQFQTAPSTTTTATSSTTTTTSSTSVTPTTPAVACQSNVPFTLSSLSNDDSGITTGYLPQELIVNGPRTDPDYLIFKTGVTAAVFTLDSSCNLVSSRNGHPATVLRQDSTAVNFDRNAVVDTGVCDIASAGGANALFCTFGSRTGSENQFAKDDAGRLHVGADYDEGIFQTTVLVNFQ